MTRADAVPTGGPGIVASARGVIYTRRWVVSMMLDLANYVPSRDLSTVRLVEPSCGDGAFILPAVERLIRSLSANGRSFLDAATAIRAYDIDEAAVNRARTQVARLLRNSGATSDEVDALTGLWFDVRDYLVPGPNLDDADLVIGNPPYVRLEHIPAATSAAYRERWNAMSGRADLYIGFIQAALESLSPGGVVAFICPDRWMRNQYGRKLRDLVVTGYSLDASITLHDADPFAENVAAYPAVVVIRRGAANQTLTVDANDRFTAAQARSLTGIHRRGPAPVPTSLAFTAAWTPAPSQGRDSWPTGSADRLRTIERLQSRFGALGHPDTGTRVGVGVATGADSVFITDDTTVAETDRLLPLVFSQEVSGGSVVSQNRYLVNPWGPDGKLVDLDDYPRMAAYLRQHAEVLRGRHVGKKNPTRWYRTIDRVDPALAGRPKLVLPDLKPRVHPVLEPGGLYPQHNLFYVVADERWDMEVLGGLLLSDLATMMVEAHSVKMASGFLRVTAQYLRRIRIPMPDEIAPAHARRLRDAFRDRDIQSATDAANAVYDTNGS